MKKAVLLAIAVLVFTSLSLSVTVHADTTVSVTATAPNVMVSVNGSVTVVPTAFSGTAEVCVLNTTVYIDSTTRYVFEGWNVGDEIIRNACITTNTSVTAVYRKYVAVVITTAPRIFTKIVWVRAGVPTQISVPNTVEEGGVRYVFSHWDGGIFTGVTMPNITVAIDTSMKLIANYGVQYPVYVNGELLGYYPQGASVFIPRNETEVGEGIIRYVSDLVAINATVTKVDNGFVVKVLGPTNITPVYSELYLVRVINRVTNTTEEKWVPAGSTYTVKTDSVVDTGSVRWVFIGWSGNITSPMNMVSFEVNHPMTIYANYKKQYPVKLVTPLSESVVYIDAGMPFTTYVTPEYATLFKAKVLKYFLVNGKPVEQYKPGVLLIPSVNEPITVVPVYETVVLWDNIAITIGLTWSFIAAYYTIKYLLSKKETH